MSKYVGSPNHCFLMYFSSFIWISGFLYEFSWSYMTLYLIQVVFFSCTYLYTVLGFNSYWPFIYDFYTVPVDQNDRHADLWRKQRTSAWRPAVCPGHISYHGGQHLYDEAPPPEWGVGAPHQPEGHRPAHQNQGPWEIP